MKKIIAVSKCSSQCPFFQHQSGKYYHYCEHSSVDGEITYPRGRFFDAQDIQKDNFPSWCPLEDK